jgi:hypothetical protein
MYDGVDRSGFGSPLVYFVKRGDNRLLVGDGNIDPQHIGSTQTPHKVLYLLWSDFPSLISAVDPIVVQRSLLEFWRYGMTDGKPDNS